MKTLLSMFLLIASITSLTACGPRTRSANNAMKNAGTEFSEDTPVDYETLEIPWERGHENTDNLAGSGGGRDFDKSDSESDKGTGTPDADRESRTGDKSTSESPTSEKPTAELKAAWDKKKIGAELTKITLAAIDEHGQNLLTAQPTDIEKFCPKYSSLQSEDKKAVWLMVISAMAYYESGFNPKAAYQESFKNSKAEPVVSRGLLQLSSESSRSYGCKIEKESDLEDPKTNLDCTVRILNQHVSSDSVVAKKVDDKWQGGARYWAVLRAQKSVPVIRKAVRKLAQCS